MKKQISTLIRVEKSRVLLIIFLPIGIMMATAGEFQMEKYDFGNKLYEYRTQKGLTQKELGKLLGVTDKAVSKWETGESKPRLDKMNQITELFETSIDRMLGKEEPEDGEQLKPYKTIFDSSLKKYSKHYKTARIWTYILTVICVIVSCLSNIAKMLNGGLATERVSSFIAIIVLASAICIFTSRFKPRFSECEYKDINIFMGFMVALFLIIGAIPVCSIVKTGEITGEYDYITIGFFCAEILILAVITVFSSLKKRYNAFLIAVCAFSVCNILIFESLYYLVITAIAVQFECFMKKRNWLSLADKADIEINKSVESQKAANIFTAVVVIITVLSITASSFSPYIIYKICLKKYPLAYIHNEVIDYDYSATFGEKFTETEIAGAKIKIPEGYEKISEDYDEYDDYRSVFYKNAQSDIISVAYFPSGKDPLHMDESDLEHLDPDEANELRTYYAKEKIIDSLYKKYYGVSIGTFYGVTYINYFVDLEDVKFYESQKVSLLIVALFTKRVAGTGGPMSVSQFDDGMYCGLVSGRQMSISGNTAVWWKADVWYSNNKEGAYYSIAYCDRNSSDITDNQMICQLVNSLEF